MAARRKSTRAKPSAGGARVVKADGTTRSVGGVVVPPVVRPPVVVPPMGKCPRCHLEMEYGTNPEGLVFHECHEALTLDQGRQRVLRHVLDSMESGRSTPEQAARAVAALARGTEPRRPVGRPPKERDDDPEDDDEGKKLAEFLNAKVEAVK